MQTNQVHNEKHDEDYFKWFKRPKQPWLPWKFTEESIEEIIKTHKHMENFTIDSLHGYMNENNDINETWSLPKGLRFKSFLRDISQNEASYPDSQESKIISKELDDVVKEMEKILRGKAKIFQDCSLIKVGSSAEGLKTGDPDEFDYNAILPGLSHYIKLEQLANEEAISVAINNIFFPELFSTNESVQTIYYVMDINSILNENLTFIKNVVLEETSTYAYPNIHRLLKKHLDENGEWKNVRDNSSKSLLVEDIINIMRHTVGQTLREVLILKFGDNISQIKKQFPKLVMPKRAVLRKFESQDQSAVTHTIHWLGGKEFEKLEISIDFAFLIPMKEQPRYFNLKKYLKTWQEQEGDLMSPLNFVHCDNVRETINYVIRSYNSCRQSMGLKEKEIMTAFPQDSVAKQTIRVCKKLRDLFMTHYFEENTEILCPFLQTYWIKTIAMHIFSRENQENVMTERDDGTLLWKYVFKIFADLDRCLAGEDEETAPYLSCFNVPFKNLFKCFENASLEDSNEYMLKDFDEMEINLMCRQKAILSDDIKILLNVLSSFDSNDGENLLEIMNEWKHDKVEENKKITEKGMREKLGMILFLNFSPLRGDDDIVPDYKKFIDEKFPNWHLVELEEEDYQEVWYEFYSTYVSINLFDEHREPYDFEFAFSRVSQKINFINISMEDRSLNDGECDKWLA